MRRPGWRGNSLSKQRFQPRLPFIELYGTRLLASASAYRAPSARPATGHRLVGESHRSRGYPKHRQRTPKDDGRSMTPEVLEYLQNLSESCENMTMPLVQQPAYRRPVPKDPP